MALSELEHWLAEAERIKAMHEQRAAAQLALIDAQAAVTEHEARVAATEKVSIGKNLDTRAALLKEALSHDGDYKQLLEAVVTQKRRAAETEGALEALRRQLDLIIAWLHGGHPRCTEFTPVVPLAIPESRGEPHDWTLQP